MQTVFDQSSPGSGHGTRPLWWAIGVLGIAVAGMAAAMVYMRTSAPGALDAQTAQAFVATQGPAAGSSGQADGWVAGNATSQRPAPVVAPPGPLPPAVRSPAAATPGADRSAPVAQTAPPGVYGSNAPVVAPQQGAYSSNPTPPGQVQPGVYSSNPSPGGSPQQGVYRSEPISTRNVCTTCGTVLSVSAVQRPGATNGTGAVAGGVLGAVVGNQIGHGSGRAVATVLGAVGGGFAGNHVEKTIKQQTVHVLRLRMDDGSVRTVEQSGAVAVGSRVVLRGGVARLA